MLLIICVSVLLVTCYILFHRKFLKAAPSDSEVGRAPRARRPRYLDLTRRARRLRRLELAASTSFPRRSTICNVTAAGDDRRAMKPARERVEISTISSSTISGSAYSSSIDDSTTTPEAVAMSQSKEQIITEKQRDLEKSNGDVVTGHQIAHPTSYLETMVHIFRGNIGSGLLAMGDAFKNGGLVFATVATVLLGVICVHAQHLLLNAAEEMFRSQLSLKPLGFAETVFLVFANGPKRLRPLANAMMVIVNTFLCVTQLGFCCVYIVFMANNVKMICDHYNIQIDLSIHMILVVVPVLLACMVRNLKYLAPLSTIANVLMAVGVGAVLYEAAQDLPPITTRQYIASWQQLPLYFGTAIYAFEGIGLVLPLKNEMRHPELFQKPLGVLNVGMMVVGSIFILVGFLGYLKWGDEVQGSLTLNLKPGMILSTVVQALITVAILFTYPLQFYVPVDITWRRLKKRFAPKHAGTKELGYRALLVSLTCPSPVQVPPEALEYGRLVRGPLERSLRRRELVFRALMVILTLILAESIPKLGLFISLVGAVSSTALALIFPPLMELVICYTKSGPNWYIFIKDVTIILLGIFIFVTGTYESIAMIVKAFAE